MCAWIDPLQKISILFCGHFVDQFDFDGNPSSRKKKKPLFIQHCQCAVGMPHFPMHPPWPDGLASIADRASEWKASEGASPCRCTSDCYWLIRGPVQCRGGCEGDKPEPLHTLHSPTDPLCCWWKETAGDSACIGGSTWQSTTLPRPAVGEPVTSDCGAHWELDMTKNWEEKGKNCQKTNKTCQYLPWSTNWGLW